MSKKKKVYPSSSAFADGGQCITQYSSGCFRNIQAQSNGLKSDIPEVYKRLGEFDENRFLQELADSGKFSVILWETSFKVEVNDYVELSGREDFNLMLKDGTEFILVEKKSTMSKNSIYGMRKGEFKLNQLAQLVAYMVKNSMTQAYLAVSGYKQDKEGNFVPTVARKTKEVDDRKFNISILNGDILIDGRLTGFTVENYINHLYTAGKHVAEHTLADRPMNHDGSFNSPCTYCDLKEVCDKVDENNLTTDEFINLAKGTMSGL